MPPLVPVPAPAAAAPRTVQLPLPLRTPYDVDWTVRGLAAHAVPGLEHWDGTSFHRTLALPHGPALVSLTLHADHALARFAHLDARDLPVAVRRLRRLADLDADPAAVDAVLAADPRLAPLVAAAPGIRCPGSVDGTETLVRVMAGQQISVAAARTRVGRLVAELGERAPWHDPARPDVPSLLFPTADRLAGAAGTALRGPRRQAQAVADAAAAIADGRLRLHRDSPTDALRADLLALPGVGPWTADLTAMRVTGDPDVLPRGDLVMNRGAADLQIDPGTTDRWRPWRSYAAMHLWRYRLLGPGAAVGEAPTAPPMKEMKEQR